MDKLKKKIKQIKQDFLDSPNTQSDRIITYAITFTGIVIIALTVVIVVFLMKNKANNNKMEALHQAEAKKQEIIMAQIQEKQQQNEEQSYIEIPGWKDRSEFEGDKEGISLSEASQPTSTKTTTAKKPVTAKPAATTQQAKPAVTTTSVQTTATVATTTAPAKTETKTEKPAVKDPEWVFAEGQSDDINHYYRDKNSDKIKTEKHTWRYTSNNENTHSKTCTVCGYTITESHTFENGICKLCGYKKIEQSDISASEVSTTTKPEENKEVIETPVETPDTGDTGSGDGSTESTDTGTEATPTEPDTDNIEQEDIDE